MATISDKTMREYIADYKIFYQAREPKNLTRKSYPNFSADDFRIFSIEELEILRIMNGEEQYQYIDQILPKSMSRGDFSRGILRELARRGQVEKIYLDSFQTSPGFDTAQVTVSRAPYVHKVSAAQQAAAPEIPQQVRALAIAVAIRDASEEIVENNHPDFRIGADLAKMFGRKNPSTLSIGTDALAYDLGYTAGSMPALGPASPLGIKLEAGQPLAQIQPVYCKETDLIFQEAARAMGNADAWTYGFMQGRIDGRSGFAPTSDNMGLTTACPRTQRAAAR